MRGLTDSSIHLILQLIFRFQDECHDRSHNCHRSGDCLNSDGSYFCQCQTGWEGDGVECTDIDECLIGTYNCPIHNECVNTDGSYYCTCISGYTNGSALTFSFLRCEIKALHFCRLLYKVTTALFVKISMNVLLVIINVTEMQIATIVATKFIVNVKLGMMVMVISAVMSTNVAKELTIVILTQNVSTPLVPTIVNAIMGKVVK